jgi:hypothetical protein
LNSAQHRRAATPVDAERRNLRKVRSPTVEAGTKVFADMRAARFSAGQTVEGRRWITQGKSEGGRFAKVNPGRGKKP